MPNPGVPNEVKRLTGSRHFSEGSILIDQVVDAPDPLRRLDEVGLDLWVRAWAMGKSWLSAQADVELLQVVCEQLDEREVLRAYVLENMEAWHERSALRKLEELIRANLSELGFSPTARSRLGLSLAKTQTKLEEIMAMRNG